MSRTRKSVKTHHTADASLIYAVRVPAEIMRCLF